MGSLIRNIRERLGIRVLEDAVAASERNIVRLSEEVKQLKSDLDRLSHKRKDDQVCPDKT